MERTTIFKITGLEYNHILMDGGLNPDEMDKLARKHIMRNWNVREEEITNVIVDKMDGVIAVTVKRRED